MSAEIKRPIEGQASIFEYISIEERDAVLLNPFTNIEKVLKRMEQSVEEETETPEAKYRLQIVKKSIENVSLAKDQIELTRKTCAQNGENMENFIARACGARAMVATYSVEKNESFLKMDILEKPMGEYIAGCDLKKSYESLCEQFLKQTEIIKPIHTLGGYRSNLDSLPHTNDGLKKTGRITGTDNIVNINDKKNGAIYNLMFGVKPRVILSVNTKLICD